MSERATGSPHAQLARLADALFEARSTADVARVAGAHVRELMGATLALLVYGDQVQRLDDAAPRDARHLAAEEALAAMVRTRGDDGSDHDARCAPQPVPAAAKAVGICTVLVAPFAYAERERAALVLAFDAERTGHATDDELCTVVARLVGRAHRQASLIEFESATREASELMGQATHLVEANADRHAVLESLARLSVPRLGDYALIDAIDSDGTPLPVGLAHVDADAEGRLRDYRSLYGARIGRKNSPQATAIETRKPVVKNDMDVAELGQFADDGEQLERLKEIRPTSYIVVPMLRFGEVLGTMSFGATDGRRYTTQDVALAVALANWVASTVHSMNLIAQSERARRESEVAARLLRVQTEELQRSNARLMAQAVELEQQTEEAQALSEELEEAIEESRKGETRFRALVEASSQAVWRADVTGTVFTPSPSMQKLTGQAASEHSEMLVHDDDRDRVVQAWRHSVETGTPFESELRVRVADGSYRWFVARAVPVYDDAGTTIREWVGAHTDITDRRRMEDEQRLLLEVSAVTRAESDPRRMVKRILTRLASHEATKYAQLLEVDVDSGMATLIDRWAATPSAQEKVPRDPALVRYSLRDVCNDLVPLMRGEPLVVEDTTTDPRTASLYKSVYERAGARGMISVPLMRGGRWVASLGVVSEVPRQWINSEVSLLRRIGDILWPAFEAARSFGALSASEARLAAVIESAMDAIIAVNADGRIAVFNAAAERIFGVPASQAVGMEVSNFFRPALTDADRGAQVIGPLGLPPTRIDHPVEVIGRRANGSTFPAEVSVSEVKRGGATVYTVVLRDVTERHALESQLLQAQKMEAVGRLAGGVAHDFNNILLVIRSCADFLRESLDEHDDRNVDVDEVLSATDRAAALTRQLLTFSRKQVTMPRLLDVNEVVRGVEPMLRRLIGEEIELAVIPHPYRASVRADLSQMEQVLINLAVNARDAMQGGGILGIETDLATLTPEDARAATLDPVTKGQRVRAGEHVVLRVTDTGSGIDDEAMRHVFEPFFTTKPEGQGTGLGLAMVHGIVAQAGGHIRVRSSLNEGTTFEVLLPRVRSDDTQEHPIVTASSQPRGTGTILLVEDEITVRRSVRRMLERVGYTVLEARHGADALMVFRENHGKVDLLITDLRMPELGGRELIAALRDQGAMLPVIAMSGYPPEMPESSPDEWGAAESLAFLPKPFTTESLLSTVAGMLSTAE